MRRLGLVLFGVGLAAVTTAPLAHAGSANSQRVLKARLSASTDVVTDAKGEARRKSEKSRKVLIQDRLTVSVKVPIPSTTPALADSASAPALALYVVFSRENAAFANCALAFDGIRSKLDANGAIVSQSAEYKLDLEMKNLKRKKSFKARKGSCDTDLAIEGAQSGIPNVKADDTIDVQSDAAFLHGEF